MFLQKEMFSEHSNFFSSLDSGEAITAEQQPSDVLSFSLGLAVYFPSCLFFRMLLPKGALALARIIRSGMYG